MPERNAATTYEIIMREGVDPVNVPGRPPLPPRTYTMEYARDLVQEKNVGIPLRDGTTIFADVYRQQGVTGKLPVLVAWGPYGKHRQAAQLWPGAEIEDGWLSELTGFESPDPAYWCAHGYAVVYVDPRGLWNSEGDYPHNGPQEGEDVYDAIEWLGAREWSTGKVGMLGVSYLAGIQYLAASMQPPSLAAISPWECFADWYREFCYHGGIPETGFQPRVSDNGSYSLNRTENTYANVQAHPLMHDYYRDKMVDMSAIKVPAYVVASWSDHGLHTRGTLEVFARMEQPDKWLEVHGQKKWRHFYHPESVERQRAFFDHFLLGLDTQVTSWPPVRVEVRDTPDASHHRDDFSWPLDPQNHTRLHLDMAAGTLSTEDPSAPSSVVIDPKNAQFDAEYLFAEEAVIVGPMRLKLWLSIDAGSDADVFVAVRKIAADGTEVRYPINALFDNGPVALGWLRASHRALIEGESDDLRPVHPHEYEEPLTPGEPVGLDIEILPSGTVFHAGEKLVLTILGRDFIASDDPHVPRILHEDLRNEGAWRLYSGGSHRSYLNIPTAR